MCGIFGVLKKDHNAKLEENLLTLSAQRLSHRGPDNLSVYSDHSAGLAHARLSLLDLSERSNQPFWDRTERYSLCYNGEIYNFRELRRELEQKGIMFRTTGDTEVLLESILFFGCAETLQKLNGMFAFALYDSQSKSFTLARDRFGIKPLFYYDGNDSFIFSSELYPIMPWVKNEANVLSAASYLQGFGHPTKGATFVKDVRIAAPGEVITVNTKEKSTFRSAVRILDLYDQNYAQELNGYRPSKVIETADRLLSASIQSQLMADVPVGALCSGGVDSAVVLAIAKKFHKDLTIFHANVTGPVSELDAARSLAGALKLDLKTIDTSPEDFISLIPEIILHHSHPFDYHHNCVPFYKVAQLVRRHSIKAVLTGEGSDESYLGYSWAVFNVKDQFRSGIKKFFRQSLLLSIKELLGRLGEKKVKLSRTPVPVSELTGYLETTYEKRLIREAIDAAVPGGMKENDLQSLFDLHYHLRTLLHRNDTLGMASGIESRFPFLDTELMRFAVNLPHRYKVRFSPFYVGDESHYFLIDKWVVRGVAKKYLPKTIASRKKAGFPTSAQERIRVPDELFQKAFLCEMLGLTRGEFTAYLSRADRRLRMRLLHLEIWGRIFLNNESLDQARQLISESVTLDA